MDRKRSGIEGPDGPDPVGAGSQISPEQIPARPDRRHQAGSGYDYAPHAVAAASGLTCRSTTATVSSTFLMVANSSSGMLILYFLSTATITSIAISESTPNSSAKRAVSVISSGSRSVTSAINLLTSVLTCSAVTVSIAISPFWYLLRLWYLLRRP